MVACLLRNVEYVSLKVFTSFELMKELALLLYKGSGGVSEANELFALNVLGKLLSAGRIRSFSAM